MVNLKSILGSTKIEPKIESKKITKNKVISLRGVKENLGTTSFINHLAITLASEYYKVCIIDLDYRNPNRLFSRKKGYSILTRLYNPQTALLAVTNTNSNYDGVYYIGANINDNLVEYLPVTYNEEFVENRHSVLTGLINQARAMYDIVLIDTPSDPRQLECLFGLEISDKVFTLCSSQADCIDLLNKDIALLTTVIGENKIKDIILVDSDVEVDVSIGLSNHRLKDLTHFKFGEEVGISLLKNKITVKRNLHNILTKEEFMYRASILKVCEEIRGVNYD